MFCEMDLLKVSTFCNKFQVLFLYMYITGGLKELANICYQIFVKLIYIHMYTMQKTLEKSHSG